MLFFVLSITFNDAQKRIGLTKYKYFFFTSLSLSLSLFLSLSPENGFPRLKIPGISSYGHFAAITWSINLDVNKLVESLSGFDVAPSFYLIA